MKITLLTLPLLLALTACGSGSNNTPTPQAASTSSSSSSSSSSKTTTIVADNTVIIGQAVQLTLDTAESIASVTWFLDTTQIGTGTAYRWTVPNLAGSHLLLAVYTTATGMQATARKPIQLVLNLPPTLLVTEPVDYETITSANGLTVAGIVNTNKPTAIIVTATLGSIPIGIGAEANSGFSGHFDITGLPAGTYKLTVTAKDSLGLLATKIINVIIR